MATVNLVSTDVVIVNTHYMLAMTLWAFASPRKPPQRAAAETYLAFVVHTLSQQFPLGFHLHIPGLAEPVNVDQQGCLDQRSWHSLIIPGCLGPEATSHPDLASYIIMALTPENGYPEFWRRRGLHLLSQLADLINLDKAVPAVPAACAVQAVCAVHAVRAKPAVPAVCAEPAGTAPASPAITSASAAPPLSDEDSDSWIEYLPSVAAFMAVLDEPATDQSHL